MKAIRIQRFKGFEDTGWIKIKPITLLYGYNSSGKSSILNVLQLLKESIENPSNEVPIVFSTKNGLDLGSYQDVVHKHEVDFKKPIIISLKLNIEDKFKQNTFKGIFLNDNVNLDDFDITFSFELAYNQKRRSTLIKGFSILDSQERRILEMTLSTNASNASPILNSDKYDVRGKKWTLGWYNFIPTFRNSEESRNELTLILNALRETIIERLSNLTSIGPVRAIPERTLFLTGDRPLSVGRNGEETFKLLYLDKFQKDSNLDYKLDEHVNEWLKEYNYSFKWVHLNAYLKQFVLVDLRNNIEVSLKDVGFGLSQILPIVIQVYYAKANDTVLIEQPEIHLHARAQADLADLFLKSIQVNSKYPYKKNLLIETHSENLLLRLRRRIAEEFLNNGNKEYYNDLAVYYISNTNGVSSIDEIELSNKGEINFMPEEFKKFFATDFEELMYMNEILMGMKLNERA
ncbi:MAG: hypothetical protein K0S47_3129 [Herbinix sp.]|nr:hypothetical protein [Herbinix sp.]